MAAPAAGITAVSPDQLITIKVAVNEQLKKLKLPLRDLGMDVLPQKLRVLLNIKPEQHMILERYSDSVAGYVTIAEDNAQVFKTLIRAAKAKLKLRLKITVTPTFSFDADNAKPEAPVQDDTQIAAARDSTALDGRSVGTGIFEFREARASRQTLVDDTVPAPTAAPVVPASITKTNLALRPIPPPQNADLNDRFAHTWSVYCNECDCATENAHFHCSICDGGDYDLCEACVAKGVTCNGDGHWLIKRYVEDGKVVTGTTTRVLSTKSPKETTSTIEKQSPEPTTTIAAPVKTFTRTCNNCVVILPDEKFVTCQSCPDYDLCIDCHAEDRHGHHPAHALKPATSNTMLSLAAKAKLSPGRNVCHNAICDGCDKKIYGIRHKCLNCPDCDYCDSCVKNARLTHPRHRFAPLYEPISHNYASPVRHFGVYCNGPLCSGSPNQSYIVGVRYKCTICHDTDFCAACEALPGNHHNRTHPLIKLRTHVREVTVSTENADAHGRVLTLGDHPSARAQAPTLSNTAKSSVEVDAVQTVADIQPTEINKPDVTDLKALHDYNLQQILQAQQRFRASFKQEPQANTTNATDLSLTAHFLRDSVPDGQVYSPEVRFTQVWTLRNPGPNPWPAGCSVKYIGGDNMLNIDNKHPASAATLNCAIESNIVGRPVLAGEEVAFRVILKAPAREGNSISYWRLKAPDGTPFGHRLWCDINVRKPGSAAASQAPSPSRRGRGADVHDKVTQSPNRGSFDAQAQIARLKAMRAVQAARHQHLRTQLQAQRDNVDPPGVFRCSFPMPSHPLGYEIPMRADVNPTSLAVSSAPPMPHSTHQNDFHKKRLDLIREQVLRARAAALDKGDEPEIYEPEATKATSSLSASTEQPEELATSQMVFPKLDKESPVSSTYASATGGFDTVKPAFVENEDGVVEASADERINIAPEYAESAFSASSPPRAVHVNHDGLEEDIEILSAVNAESESDGFLTDDEYDILDASDRETVF